MSSTSRRVVITGLGTLTPVGIGAAAFWEGLLAGKTGVGPIRTFPAQALGAEVVGFEPKQYIEKKERKNLRVMARAIQLAVAGAQLALDDSKVDKTKLDPTRFGISFGASLIPMEMEEIGAAALVSQNCKPGVVDMKRWGEQGIPAIPPLWMLKYLPNMLACHVSILHNAQGPNNSVTESEAAGLLALGEAVRILRRDQADFFLVGSGDAKVHPLTILRQMLFGKMSKRLDAPEKASRPFDQGRDGFVLGEGAGILALEDLEHAQRRGAPIHAEVVGFGAAFDRGLKTQGLARAVQIAFAQAGIGPGDLDHVNAHGLSSPSLDAWEAKNLHQALGGQNVTVWGLKSYLGHLGSAGGTTELAGSILAMKAGVLPPTLNYETPDPECPVKVETSARAVAKPYFLKVSYTEMGQCAALVCRRWDDR